MLVRIVTASNRVRSAPIGTPALAACAAARIMAVPPRACTLTSCTPGIAAEASTAPATVFGMSWNFRSRKIPVPSCATWRTASGPAVVKSWLPILNMPTRSATCLANFSAELRESKSRATTRLLRGWASKLKVSGRARNGLVRIGPRSGVLRRYLQQFQPNLTHSRSDQTYLPGYAIGYINFASFLVGSAVIDARYFEFAIAQVDDAHPRTKG